MDKLKSIKLALKLILKWITLNWPQIIFICGFCFISIGFFLLLPAIGYMSVGVSLIILAILAYTAQ